MIKIEIQVPEVVTVTIDDVDVSADNEDINDELRLLLGCRGYSSIVAAGRRWMLLPLLG